MDENMEAEATEISSTATSSKDKQVVPLQSGSPNASGSTRQETPLSASKKKPRTRQSTELFGLGLLFAKLIQLSLVFGCPPACKS